jgi:hypothetical protein
MNMGITRNHLFFHTISRKCFVFPHEIPTMANRIPLNPIVGSLVRHGISEQSTAMEYVAMRCSLHGSIHRQMIFASRCHILACEIG